MAINEFEFNEQLYQWAKRTIELTSARNLEEDISNYKRASNFEEYVLAHNLKMLEKHEDELRFAVNYKISTPSSIKQNTIRIVSDLEDRQPLVLKPSS